MLVALGLAWVGMWFEIQQSIGVAISQIAPLEAHQPAPLEVHQPAPLEVHQPAPLDNVLGVVIHYQVGAHW